MLCTVSIGTEPPRWLLGPDGVARRGWVTAEYAMLPGSTPSRKPRGSDGRATEIQRLIARALRAAIDLEHIPGLTFTCDCDVLAADGGTRTASITGACVALRQAVLHAMRQGLIARDPWRGYVAAISAGVVDAEPVLDLDYALDSRADVDLNVVMDQRGGLIEVQGTGERCSFDRAQLDRMLDLAAGGIRGLIALQRRCVAGLNR